MRSPHRNNPLIRSILLSLIVLSVLALPAPFLFVLLRPNPVPYDAVIGVCIAVTAFLTLLLLIFRRARTLFEYAQVLSFAFLLLVIELFGVMLLNGRSDEIMALFPPMSAAIILLFVSLGTLLMTYLLQPRWMRHVRTLPAARRCRDCGYDLRLLRETRCPECGTPFTPLLTDLATKVRDE